YCISGAGDGGHPLAGLILSGSSLYGTTAGGGSSCAGTVFAVNTDGTGFTNLHDFNNSDGNYLVAGLILSGNTIYGTAKYGVNSGNGTMFKLNTDGSGFTNIYSFTATPVHVPFSPPSTNSDGTHPQAGLLLSGNTLNGTASEGGSSGFGTVFAVNVNGTGFTNLHSFTRGTDGANPYGGLITNSSGSTLYGT